MVWPMRETGHVRRYRGASQRRGPVDAAVFTGLKSSRVVRVGVSLTRQNLRTFAAETVRILEVTCRNLPTVRVDKVDRFLIPDLRAVARQRPCREREAAHKEIQYSE